MAILELSVATGEEPFRVRHFATEEGLSSLFSVSVWALCPNANVSMDGIVGHPARFHIEAGLGFAMLGGTRSWTGICNYFEQARVEPHGESTYRIDIVPRLWLLTQRSDHRIFQYLNIPDIIDHVLQPWGIEAEWRVDKLEYPRLAYRTQYGESDYAFFKRLLEEAGLAYSYGDEADQGPKLVIGDHFQAASPRSAPPLLYLDNPKHEGDAEIITHARLGHGVRPGALTFRGQDYRKPDQHPGAEATKAVAPEDRYEQYRYHPDTFLVDRPKAGTDTPNADDRGGGRHDPPWGARNAEIALQSLRVDKRSLSFATNTIDLWPGAIFSVRSHPHAELAPDKLYLLTSFTITGEPNTEWGMEGTAVRADVPFRLAQQTPKPLIHATQVATVVGPVEQEIHTDEYGRVRVSFPWDRSGRKDAQSSIWMRVNQAWAGKAFGMFQLPRVGQEVLVSFIDGDPDDPVVVGRLHNLTHPVQYRLPEYKTRAVWKGDSSPGATGHSEIIFEDIKGDEFVSIYAERHVRTLIKNDETITVEHDRDKVVELNETDTTLVNRTEVTVVDRTETTEGHREVFVAMNRAHLTRGDNDERIEIEHVVRVEKDLHETTKGDKKELVEIDQHATVRHDRRIQVDKDLSLAIGVDHFLKVGDSYALDAGSEVQLSSGDVMVGEAPDVTVRGPGGFLRIDGSGIVISGTMVYINDGSGALAGKGADPKKPAAAAEAKAGKPCPPQNPEIATVSGPQDLGCGGYSWKVWFNLPKPACTPGWIVQEIIATFTVEDKKGKTLTSATRHYWEAWEVKKGKTGTVWQDEKLDDNDDLYYSPSQPNTKGTTTVRGIARFFEGPLPGDFKKNGVPMAGILHATTKKPAFWDTKGIIHDLTSVWDCTVTPETGNVNGKAGALEIKGTK